MSFSNLLDAYEFERKRQVQVQEIERHEQEKLIKLAHDVGATVLNTKELEERRTKKKQDIPSSSPQNIQNKASTTAPKFAKKRNLDPTAETTAQETQVPVNAARQEEPSNADSTAQQKESYDLILQDKEWEDADPINSKLPNIIDWVYVGSESLISYRVTRRDQSMKVIAGFSGL